MTACRFTRQADKNLGEIYLHTAGRFGIRQADKYANELKYVFGLLADHPSMGRAADDINSGLRCRMRPDLDPED